MEPWSVRSTAPALASTCDCSATASDHDDEHQRRAAPPPQERQADEQQKHRVGEARSRDAVLEHGPDPDLVLGGRREEQRRAGRRATARPERVPDRRCPSADRTAPGSSARPPRGGHAKPMDHPHGGAAGSPVQPTTRHRGVLSVRETTSTGLEEVHMSPTAPSRLGAGCGVAAVVGLMTLTGDGEENASAARLGGEILALLLFVPFLAYLFSLLRDAERRAEWLPVTMLAAGLLAITVKVVSVVPVIAIRRGGVDGSLHARVARSWRMPPSSSRFPRWASAWAPSRPSFCARVCCRSGWAGSRPSPRRCWSRTASPWAEMRGRPSCSSCSGPWSPASCSCAARSWPRGLPSPPGRGGQAGQPPVGVAEQLHRRRHEDQPHDRGVDEDRRGQAEAEHLDRAGRRRRRSRRTPRS